MHLNITNNSKAIIKYANLSITVSDSDGKVRDDYNSIYLQYLHPGETKDQDCIFTNASPEQISSYKMKIESVTVVNDKGDEADAIANFKLVLDDTNSESQAVPVAEQNSTADEKKVQTLGGWIVLIEKNAKLSAITDILGKPDRMTAGGGCLEYVWDGALDDGTKNGAELGIAVTEVQNEWVVVGIFNPASNQVEPFPWFDKAMNAARDSLPQ